MDSQFDRTRLSCEGMLGRAGSNSGAGRILATRKTIMIDPLNSWNMTEETDCMVSALAAAAVQGTCPFGRSFESEFCLPFPEEGDCAMCVNKYMMIWLKR